MNVRIVGRSSSHFTRVACLFAEELGVPWTLDVVHDLTSETPATFGGNPALKIPTLVEGDVSLFGTENICRRLVELCAHRDDVVLPEALTSPLLRNAQELTWHAMAAQVQLVFGTVVHALPADDGYFRKAAAGLTSSLAWLDQHLAAVLAALPPRRLSLLEVTLFCLVEHLAFRRTVSLEPLANLRAFAAEFSRRPSASRTAYRFDAKG